MLELLFASSRPSLAPALLAVFGVAILIWVVDTVARVRTTQKIDREWPPHQSALRSAARIVVIVVVSLGIVVSASVHIDLSRFQMFPLLIAPVFFFFVWIDKKITEREDRVPDDPFRDVF